jgi:ubiquinone/menaquinone biosynthesis C-methylase UbiE
MRKMGKAVLIFVGGFLFIWVFVLKVASRLAARFGRSTPCPAALSFIVYNPIRRYYMRPVLERVGIRSGESVLELGPGPGAFTVEAARQAGAAGRLFAVDIQPQMIAHVEEQVRQAGLTNVQAHVASAYDLPLEDESVDRAFLITVLPEIPDRDRALAELYRVLRPGGTLSITEEFLDPDYLFAQETIRLVEKAGFKLEQRLGSFWIYTLNFSKQCDPNHRQPRAS